MATYKIVPYQTGKTLYGIFFNQVDTIDGNHNVFNSGNGTVALWSDVNMAQCAISMYELGTSGNYKILIPTALPVGVYSLFVYNQIGATPAIGDMSGGPVAVESGISWTGGSTGTEVVQTGDSFAALNRFSGMFLTGLVLNSPAPTQTVFTIVLDSLSNLTVSTVSSDFTLPPLYVTFRNGANISSYAKITGCTIQSVSQIIITVSSPGFAVTPTGGTVLAPADLVIISG